MYVCMDLYVYEPMHMSLHACVHVCTCVRMYGCTYAHRWFCKHTYICLYVYIYTYTYTRIHTHTHIPIYMCSKCAVTCVFTCVCIVKSVLPLSHVKPLPSSSRQAGDYFFGKQFLPKDPCKVSCSTATPCLSEGAWMLLMMKTLHDLIPIL